MAVINRNTLVLTGVSVARDVVTGTMGNGLISASGRPTMSLFTTRHPSQRYPQAEQVPGPRHDHAEGGVNQAADGAGRSRSCDGFLASRSTASFPRTSCSPAAPRPCASICGSPPADRRCTC